MIKALKIKGKKNPFEIQYFEDSWQNTSIPMKLLIKNKVNVQKIPS